MTTREESIVRVLLRHPDSWITRREIARHLGLKKTPYIAELIDSLVDRGVIRRELGSWGGFSCWFYSALWSDVCNFTMLSEQEFLEGEVSGHGKEQ